MKTLTDFYRQQKWRQLRSHLMLERVNSKGELLCEHCGKLIVKGSGCIVHHIIPLTVENMDDWNIAFNPKNLMLVHSKCHNEIHERFGNWQKKVVIVHGSPCSGKTYYVNENKAKNDLVVDLDSIYFALSHNAKYENNPAIKDVVFAVRESIYNSITNRLGDWKSAWVICSTLYFPIDRENLSRQLNATDIIYIKNTKENCLENLYSDTERNNPFIQNKWKEFIEDFFFMFVEGGNETVEEMEKINKFVF